MANTEDRSQEVAGVAGFFLALSTVSIALRCYCRIKVVKSFGWDDWFAVLAYLFFVFFCAFAITGTLYGTGRHTQDIPPADIPIALKWWWACEPVYVLSNMALKMSIGLFLLRIVVEPVHKYTILAVLVVTELFGAAFFFLFLFQCQPSSYFWNRFAGNGATGNCIDNMVTVKATYTYSAVSCWGDWTFSIIPIFMIRNLQMTPRTKLVVVFILALGGIASTATIIRIPYVHYMADIADFLYMTTDVAIWSTAETGIGISASSFATLRPLFRRFLSGSRLSGTPHSKPTGSTPRQRSNSAPGRAGYLRSGSQNHTLEEFDLRRDVGRNGGVTTVIKSEWSTTNGDTDLERGSLKGNAKGGKKGRWNKNTMWSTSESRLADDSGSEEVDHTISGWGSRGQETGHEIRIEVNRTVVQSSAVSSLKEET